MRGKGLLPPAIGEREAGSGKREAGSGKREAVFDVFVPSAGRFLRGSHIGRILKSDRSVDTDYARGSRSLVANESRISAPER